MDNPEKQFNHIDINHPKIHKIINAALEVFTQNDLKKASTNQIVKLAGISRGLLYHYFKDKDELFNFLLFFSLKITISQMDKKIDWEDRDFLNRIMQMIAIRIDVISNYPYIIGFFEKYNHLIDKSKIRLLFEKISPGMRDKFYSYNLDFSQLKEGVDQEKMINIIKWTTKGMLQEWLEKARVSQDIDAKAQELIKKFSEYIEFLRMTFYQNQAE